MADAFLGFKRFTRIFLQYRDSGVPIAVADAPSVLDLVPGVTIAEVDTVSLQGEITTAFAYPNEIRPQINCTFPTSTPDLDALILNRVPTVETNQLEFSYIEALSQDTSVNTVPPKGAGIHGVQIPEVAAGDTTAKAYYIDPETKLQVSLAFADFATGPVGSEVAVGAGGEIKFGPTIAALSVNVYFWIPTTYSQVTVHSGIAPGIISAYLFGVHFDGTVKMASASNCIPLLNGSLNNGPREINLRVLPDPNSRTNLGFDVMQTDEVFA